MDAYDIFDKKHEQYPDESEQAERWAFEKEHRDTCPMDRLAVVRTISPPVPIACCAKCWKKVWAFEGAQLVCQHRIAA